MALQRAVTEHLATALRGGEGEPFTRRTLGVAVLAVAAPVLAGAAAGRPDLGLTVGLGAMLFGGETAASADGSERPSPGSAAAPALAAVGLALVVAPWPLADGVMLLACGLAAAVSGYSRPVAIAAIRFLIYLVLSLTLFESAGPRRGEAALVFAVGALWNITMRVLLSRRSDTAAVPIAAARQPTPAQRRAYFKRTLKTLAGWQFPLRVVLGLAAAIGLERAFPERHYAWIVLTVTLLTQRPLEHLPVKITQRTAGTLVGVLATGLALWAKPSGWALALVVAALGTVAVLARTRNYLLYAAAATPVILLALNVGKPVAPALLWDRLAATFIAAVIVVALNVGMDRLLALAPALALPTRRPTAS